MEDSVQELGHRLMQQPAVPTPSLSTILGSLSSNMSAALADLNRPRLRLGLWPFTSDEMPEVAMGIAATLGFLLERWQEVRVYRLFAQVTGAPEAFEWSVARSQFTPDDWGLDSLDENVAVWGTLERTEVGLKLTIQIEGELAEAEDEVKAFVHVAASLTDLLGDLPPAASTIAAAIGAAETRMAMPVYSQVQADGDKLSTLIRLLFQWELQLYLMVWGKPWSDTEIVSAADQLLEAAQDCADEFAAWAVSSAVARAILPVFRPINELLTSVVDKVASSIPNSVFPAILLASALFRSGQNQVAYDLLEEGAEAHPGEPELWLVLAELYRQGGHVNEAVDAFQRAIESDAVNAGLYLRYGDLMLAIDSQGWNIEGFILVNPAEKRGDLLAWEAVEAYEAALELEPSNVEALYHQLGPLADLDDKRLWPRFKRLVELDQTGEQVRSVVEALYGVDDISPMLETLQSAARSDMERSDLHLNLGAAYLVAEDGKRAKAALENARRLTADPLVRAEIDRLMLAAEDPEFEAKLGEITDLIGAGNALDEKDVDFLEAALEKAPRFPDLYLMLAQAYQLWEESEAALEILLDGEKNLADDPDILERLARTLWDAGESELAFDYLNKGLATHSNHVPLLALTGRYLFDNGQEEAARVFLARAEAIAPRHPAVNEVRVYIANAQG